MSSSPGRREVAHRLFAAEFDAANLSYSESDEERAPNYVVTPTGARVNRLFFVGVLTEKERVNEDMLRARIVDPTGAFVTYAGQYQPDELAYLERVDPPAFLAVTGKARTFQPEDSDRVYTSARPESISRVDADTRDRWVVRAAERTVDRVRVMASAIESELRGDALEAALSDAGIDASFAQGIALALDHYGTTPAYLAEQRRAAVQAAEMITDERDEIDRPSLAPDEGDGDAAELANPDLVDAIVGAEPEAEAAPAGETAPESEPDDAELAASEPESDATETAEAEPEASEPEPEATGGESAMVEAGVGESTAEPEDAAVAASEEDDDLGDFEPGEFDAEDVDEDDLDDALTDEERQEVKENFDTDFSTGNEMGDDPLGEDDEEADRPDEAAEDADETDESDPTSPGEPDSEVSPAAEEDPEAQYETEPESSENLDTGVASEPGEEDEVDLESAVMETMSELDNGDGADHDEVVQAVADEYGVAVGDAEDAVQDALMSGQCYEPADGKLKPI